MTPQSIDSDVHKLIKFMGIKTPPIYVNVQLDPNAGVKDCFPSVAAKVDKDGGEQVLGWVIWKSNILIEAELHALWKSPDNELLDITPREIVVDRILFVEDPKATYDGRQVDNVRLNIYRKPLVDDFIIICKGMFKLINKDDLAYQHGEIHLSGKNAEMYRSLHQLKEGIFWMIENEKSHNSRCFCGSQGKYKHCHGRGIRKILKHI